MYVSSWQKNNWELGKGKKVWDEFATQTLLVGSSFLSLNLRVLRTILYLKDISLTCPKVEGPMLDLPQIPPASADTVVLLAAA